MAMQQNARIILVIVAASIAASACGVKSSPQRRPDGTYSHQYPEALPPLEVKQPAEPEGQPPSAPAIQPGAVYPNTAPAAGR